MGVFVLHLTQQQNPHFHSATALLLATNCSCTELESWDQELMNEPEVAALVASTEPPPYKFHLLDLVVKPLLDANRDGVITRPELRALQLQAEDFAAREAMDPPATCADMVKLLVMGVDTDTIKSEALAKASGPLTEVLEKLKVMLAWHA